MTRNLTILFTDIKGFTARTSAESREGINQMLTEHERLLLPVFHHFDGIVVKTIGDAFLVRFDSPTDAVLCGLTIQEVLRQHNSFAADNAHKLEVRVAINCGEVELRDKDVLGEPVNLAARLEAITEAGEVYFTEAVHLAMKRSEVPSSQVGEHTFKGIPYSVRVYKVIRDPKSPQMQHITEAVRLTKDGPVIRGLRQSRSRPWLVRGVALGALAIILLVAFFLGLPSLHVQQSTSAARQLIAKGQGREALDVLEAELAKNPDQPTLRRAAVDAAETHLNKLLIEGQKQAAFDWLTEVLAAKPYLESLRHRLPAVEADAEISRLVSVPGNDQKIADKAGKLLAKYPQDPDVPFVMAETQRRAGLVKNAIPLYKRALQNGHAVDPAIFEACALMFTRYYGAFAVDARELAAKHFPKERVDWARQALTDIAPKSSADRAVYIVLNAWDILIDTKDPLTQDTFNRHLVAIARAKRGGEGAPTLADLEDACATFQKATDREQVRRAVAILGDTHFAVPEPTQRLFQSALANLLQR